MTTEQRLLSENDVQENAPNIAELKNLARSLKKFFGKNERQALVAILREIKKNPGITHSEIFRKLSAGEGRERLPKCPKREGHLPEWTVSRPNRRVIR